MDNGNRKYKRININYIYTSFILYMLLFILVVGLLIAPITNVVAYLSKDVKDFKFFSLLYYRNFLKIHSALMWKYILIEVIAVISYVYVVFKDLTSKMSTVNRKLVKLILRNNLVIYETKQGVKKIVDKPIIRYSYKNDNLKIKVELNGGKSDKFFKEEARTRLEDLFGQSMSNISQKFGSIEYEFCFNGQGRLREFIYQDGVIPLDYNDNWEYDQDPHCIIAGSTGSGKTYFLNYIICNLVYQKAEIYFIDPKRADVLAIGKVVNNKVACYEDEIIKMLEEIKQKMDERMILIEKVNKTNATYRDLGLCPLFLVFDEVAAVKAMFKKENREKMDNLLKNVVMMGRSIGVQVILVMQQPNAEVIPTAIRDNMGFRVYFGTPKTEVRNMIFGANLELMTISKNERGVGYFSLRGSEPYLYYSPNLGYKFDFVEEIERLKL